MKYINLLMALCCGLTLACSSEKKEDESKNAIQNYPVVLPAVLDTVYTKQYVAEIQSVQNVEIRSKTKGVIEKIWVDEGKYVAAGQTIYSINNSALRV